MVPPQADGWAQLIYATQGILQVESPPGERLWFVPAHRALWVPAGTRTLLAMRGEVRLRMIYLASDECEGLPVECRGLNVPPLLREVVLEVVRRSVVPRGEPLAELLRELITGAETAPLALPMPQDARARRVAEMLVRDPSCSRTLVQLGHSAGASTRTLERLFSEETGLRFSAWRQRLRVLSGLDHMLHGASVAEAAFAVGYENTSAFIAIFRETLGETPGKWLRK
jgi:AraC-like DNA-binding protein